MGMLPSPGHAAAKAKAAPHGHAAAKAWACMQQPRHLGQGCGMLAWARWHAPGRRQQGPWGHAARALACTLPDGAVAARRGRGMPRGWDAKAVACPWEP